MTKAEAVAYAFYAERVYATMQDQFARCERGDKLIPAVILAAPVASEVKVIEKALAEAKQEAVEELLHQALMPFINALDALDNSPLSKKKKKDDVSELLGLLRLSIQGGYDELHALKKAATA